jgi:hypothetical protein
MRAFGGGYVEGWGGGSGSGSGRGHRRRARSCRQADPGQGVISAFFRITLDPKQTRLERWIEPGAGSFSGRRVRRDQQRKAGYGTIAVEDRSGLSACQGTVTGPGLQA